MHAKLATQLFCYDRKLYIRLLLYSNVNTITYKTNNESYYATNSTLYTVSIYYCNLSSTNAENLEKIRKI